MKKAILLSYLYLSLLSFSFGQTNDFTRISTNSANESIYAIGISPDMFVIGGSRYDDVSACADGWLEAYDKNGVQLWDMVFEETDGINSILYDSLDQSFLVGLSPKYTDVAFETLGSLLRIDLSGNILKTVPLGWSDFPGSLTITGDDEIVFRTYDRLNWFNRNLDSVFVKEYDSPLKHLARINSDELITHTSDELFILDNRGEIKQRYNFTYDPILHFDTSEDSIYMVHENSIRRFIPSTQQWDSLTYDNTTLNLNKIHTGFDFAYLSGKTDSGSIPIFIPLNKLTFQLGTEILFQQSFTDLLQIAHFDGKVLLTGNTNFYFQLPSFLRFSISSRNGFFHFSDIGKTPTFSDVAIAISNFQIIPASIIDSTINIDSTVIYDSGPIIFETEILNQSQDTIHSVTLVSSDGGGVECIGVFGKLHRTYTALNLAPGEQITIIDSTKTGRRFTADRVLIYNMLAYAPNQQFDQNMDNNISSDSINFLVNTQNLSKLPQTTIFPNPATKQLTIISGGNRSMQQLQLYDLSGQEKWSITPNSSEVTADVSSLSAGAYFVKITTKQGVIFKKIIKQ